MRLIILKNLLPFRNASSVLFGKCVQHVIHPPAPLEGGLERGYADLTTRLRSAAQQKSPLGEGLERGYAALTTRLRSAAQQKSPLEEGRGVKSRTLSLTTLLFLLPFIAFAQTDTLRLIFAGDIMGHAPQIKSAEVVAGKKYDYSPCFKYVKPILDRADLAIGNLELTLPGKPPYNGYPMFRSPDDLAAALKEAGFDLLVTANNHSNDSRGAGVVSTVNTLRELGFHQTGTFKNATDRGSSYPLMMYKDNFKLAFLNYTYGTNGVPTDAPTIVNLIDTVQMKKDLTEARARKPHFIIAVMHWGLEYQLKENDEQRRLAKFLIRNGADMVIGAHPHVVQPIRTESVKMPDGSTKKAIVVYSLGNFISNQQQPNTDGGILFQVDLLKQRGSPKVTTANAGMIPIWRYIHKASSGKSTFYALPIARLEKNPDLLPSMADTARTKMKQFAEALRKRIDYPEIK